MKNKLLLLLLVFFVVSAAFAVLEMLNPAPADFSDCNGINYFKKNEWFKNFEAQVLDANLALKDISDACYSADADQFILMIPGEMCQGSRIFRYDIKSHHLDEATFNNYSRLCKVVPTEFGVERNSSILLGGVSVEGSCNSVMSFEYDYLHNKVSLSEEYTICAGDSEGTWKKY